MSHFHCFSDIRATIPTDVELVVVTKTIAPEGMQSVIDGGALAIGENRVQEAVSKFDSVAFGKTSRHLIGHLQSNKVAKAISLFDCIQSIDSEPLLRRLDQVAGQIERQVEVLLQVNVGSDSAKFGLAVSEFRRMVDSDALKMCSWVSVKGIMVIAPLGLNHTQLRQFFRQSRQQFDWFRTQMPHVTTLSMGMSQDYQIAIDEGSTMVRIGSLIFKQ